MNPSAELPLKKKKYPAMAKIRTSQTALAIPAALPGVISLFLEKKKQFAFSDVFRTFGLADDSMTFHKQSVCCSSI